MKNLIALLALILFATTSCVETPVPVNHPYVPCEKLQQDRDQLLEKFVSDVESLYSFKEFEKLDLDNPEYVSTRLELISDIKQLESYDNINRFLSLTSTDCPNVNVFLPSIYPFLREN